MKKSKNNSPFHDRERVRDFDERDERIFHLLFRGLLDSVSEPTNEPS